MTKLYLDGPGLNNKVLPYLDQAINNLNSAVNDVGYLNIPIDFAYASYLKQLINKNAELRDSLSKQRAKIESSITNFNNVSKSNIDARTSINNFELPTRNSAIN